MVLSFHVSCSRAWARGRRSGLQARRPLPFWPLLSVGVSCFVPPPPQPAPLGLHQASLNTTHSRNQTHSLAPVVSLSADYEFIRKYGVGT